MTHRTAPSFGGTGTSTEVGWGLLWKKGERREVRGGRTKKTQERDFIFFASCGTFGEKSILPARMIRNGMRHHLFQKVIGKKKEKSASGNQRRGKLKTHLASGRHGRRELCLHARSHAGGGRTSKVHPKKKGEHGGGGKKGRQY